MFRYTVESIPFSVIYVIRHAVRRVIWSNTSAYIVGSGHTPVKYVIRHSVGSLIWSDISAYIVGSGHTLVMYVIRRSGRRVIWSNIRMYIVSSSHNPVVCKSEVIWSHIAPHVVVTVCVSVMCRIRQYCGQGSLVWHYSMCSHKCPSFVVCHVAFSWRSCLITYQLWWWLTISLWCDSIMRLVWGLVTT